jgi:hypothetical protein
VGFLPVVETPSELEYLIKLSFDPLKNDPVPAKRREEFVGIIIGSARTIFLGHVNTLWLADRHRSKPRGRGQRVRCRLNMPIDAPYDDRTHAVDWSAHQEQEHWCRRCHNLRLYAGAEFLLKSSKLSSKAALC